MFRIDTSSGEGEPALFPAPDLAVCASCLAEMGNPAHRRHHYPFLNCTDCGPRFTIIDRLPYDRDRTSMATFTMCAERAMPSISTPGNRRFHAEPTACPTVGRASDIECRGRRLAVATVERAVTALRAGAILAVKGLGGYHLACDATNAGTVSELRRRKARETKPLALMVRAWRRPGALRRLDR